LTGELSLDCEVRGKTAEVSLKGDLDMSAAFKLEPAIERLVSENAVDALVLDLAGVDFIDSAGVGSLLATHERLHDLGINATVKRASATVERVLDVSGTRTVLFG
jgi:anti-anti-sigma factor